MERNIVINALKVIKLMETNAHYAQILKVEQIVILKMEMNIAINVKMVNI